MIVYPLWHVGHQNEAGDDGTTVHVDESGVFCDESDGDDVKLLGIYSTLERVEERVGGMPFRGHMSPRASAAATARTASGFSE
ncbi:hypothetical protein [Streptomyces sp. NPDC059378]|uniref:hypothetical protein n=1 Tax=Streptomyces sp. NPDC059378 TaxID=3346815 RepID=UPI0036A4408D